MKKVILRIAVLFVIFVGGVIGFSQLLNQQSVETTREMEEPTLPTLCIDYNGYKNNIDKHHIMVFFKNPGI